MKVQYKIETADLGEKIVKDKLVKLEALVEGELIEVKLVESWPLNSYVNVDGSPLYRWHIEKLVITYEFNNAHNCSEYKTIEPTLIGDLNFKKGIYIVRYVQLHTMRESLGIVKMHSDTSGSLNGSFLFDIKTSYLILGYQEVLS